MEIITSDFNGWQRRDHGFLTGEGLYVSAGQAQNLCQYNGVPQTLVNIDAIHGTNVTLEVLKAVSKTKPSLMVDNNEVLNVMDPKSRFISDEEFKQITNSFSKFGLSSSHQSSRGARKLSTFDLPSQETDSVLGDVFKRRIHIDRLPQGGLAVMAGLLRLICTNGCVVADNQYRHMFRTNIDETKLSAKVASIMNLQVEEYFKKLFSHNGQWVEASVANFLGMKKTLSQVASKEIADKYFISEPMEQHYSAQGTDINKLPVNMLEKLPSGLTYFDCFNILTHGAKEAEYLSTSEEIAIGQWGNPRKLDQMKATSLGFKGKPVYDPSLVAQLRGDVAA